MNHLSSLIHQPVRHFIFYAVKLLHPVSFVCLMLMAVPVAGQLSSGQLVHYPFNGNAQDTGVFGYHATEINNPTYTSNSVGTLNSALLLNGTDQRIDLPATAGIRPTTFPISFSFWFRISSFQNGNAKLFYSNFNTAAHQGYYCQVSGSFLELSFGDGNGLGVQNRMSYFINQNFQTNTWYHVALVVSSPTQASAWVDCQSASVSTSGTAGSFAYGTAPGHLGMGRQNTTTNAPAYFNGALDEFRLWNRALTSDELEQLCVMLCTNISVSENEKGSELNAFPNPTQDILYVQAPENSSLMLVDMNGKTIRQLTTERVETSIDMSCYAQGVYMLQIQTGNAVETRRIVRK
jgi:hypothetical protein